MTHQQNLFDDERPAKIVRDADPETSHAAAAEVLPKLSVLEERMYAGFVQECPCTANEAAEATAQGYRFIDPQTNYETYRKRYDALLKKRRIFVDGKKRCSVTGKLATVYKITEENND